MTDARSDVVRSPHFDGRVLPRVAQEVQLLLGRALNGALNGALYRMLCANCGLASLALGSVC